MIVFNAKWLLSRMKRRIKFYVFFSTILLLFLFFVQKKFEWNLKENNSAEESSFIQKQSREFGEKSQDDHKQFYSVNEIIPESLGITQLNSANRTNHLQKKRKNSDLDYEYKVYTFKASKSLEKGVTRYRIPPRDKVFSTLMTGQERTIVYLILEALDAATAKYGIKYFLCGGTLLGSYRHHDLIPWDDDVDVYMNITEKDDAYAVLDALSPSYSVFSAGVRLKLYSQYSQKTSRYSWKYPYVDINFFKENATHIMDSDPVFESLAYRKEKVFPLHRRPLGGLFPYAPLDTLYFLRNTYQELTYCVTNPYDHRSEHFLGTEGAYYTPCRKLKQLFPFVYRSLDPDTNEVRETTKIGATEIRTIVVEEPPETVGDPFGLEKGGGGRRRRRRRSGTTTQDITRTYGMRDI